MLNLRKVAVTGGLSSGKSSVCRFFKELGAYVMSADEIVHQLLSPDTNLGQKVIHLIGSDILINHQIDRTKIAEKVFNQPELLKSLEELLHPAVREQIEKKYEEIRRDQSAPLFVAEIPLLFETGSVYSFDSVIAVVSDEKECKNRFQRSTGKNGQEFEKRAARQLSMEQKAQKADIVIHNNGSLEELKSIVKKIYTKLIPSVELNNNI